MWRLVTASLLLPLSSVLMLRAAAPVPSGTANSLGLAPPFCPCRMKVCTDDTAIDIMNLPVQLPVSIGKSLQRLENLVPEPTAPPAIEPTRYRPIALWQIPPRCPGPENPQPAIYGGTVIVTGTTHSLLLSRQEGLETLPLLMCQVSSTMRWKNHGGKSNATTLEFPTILSSFKTRPSSCAERPQSKPEYHCWNLLRNSSLRTSIRIWRRR